MIKVSFQPQPPIPIVTIGPYTFTRKDGRWYRNQGKAGMYAVQQMDAERILDQLKNLGGPRKCCARDGDSCTGECCKPVKEFCGRCKEGGKCPYPYPPC